MYPTVIRLCMTALMLAVVSLAVAGVLWFQRAEHPNHFAQGALAVCCLASLGGVWKIWSAPREHGSL